MILDIERLDDVRSLHDDAIAHISFKPPHHFLQFPTPSISTSCHLLPRYFTGVNSFSQLGVFEFRFLLFTRLLELNLFLLLSWNRTESGIEFNQNFLKHLMERSWNSHEIHKTTGIIDSSKIRCNSDWSYFLSPGKGCEPGFVRLKFIYGSYHDCVR